ncbi:hypothetical protein M569_08712, partial [Genlisea aurea]
TGYRRKPRGDIRRIIHDVEWILSPRRDGGDAVCKIEALQVDQIHLVRIFSRSSPHDQILQPLVPLHFGTSKIHEILLIFLRPGNGRFCLLFFFSIFFFFIFILCSFFKFVRSFRLII